MSISQSPSFRVIPITEEKRAELNAAYDLNRKETEARVQATKKARSLTQQNPAKSPKYKYSTDILLGVKYKPNLRLNDTFRISKAKQSQSTRKKEPTNSFLKSLKLFTQSLPGNPGRTRPIGKRLVELAQRINAFRKTQTKSLDEKALLTWIRECRKQERQAKL